MVIVFIGPGRFGSMAAYTPTGEVLVQQVPNSPAGMKRLLEQWLNTYGTVAPIIYFDEFYMLNSVKLDNHRIDMAEYGYKMGIYKGICYSYAEFLVPIEAREMLLKDLGIAEEYDVGIQLESIAYDVAAKAYPSIKKDIDSTGEMFFHLAPSLAILSKIMNGGLYPTESDSNIFRAPDSYIFD